METEQVEVTVEVTEEPSNQQQVEPNPNQSTEMTVGELKAKVEQLQTEVTELKNKDNQLEQLMEQVQQIHRWTNEEISDLARTMYQQMNNIEEKVLKIESDDLTENIEQENEPSNNEEIPLVPEPVEQQEPQEVTTTTRKRPRWL